MDPIMKKIVILLSAQFFVGCFCLKAEEFNLASNYTLSTEEDFKQHQNTAIQAMEWILENPVTVKMEQRRKVSLFLFQWLEGSNFDIPFNDELLGDVGVDERFMFNAEFLIIYMSGVALEQLNNKQDNAVLLQKAGLMAMIDAYKFVKNSSASEHLEKLEQLSSAGELDAWIVTTLASRTVN